MCGESESCCFIHILSHCTINYTFCKYVALYDATTSVSDVYQYSYNRELHVFVSDMGRMNVAVIRYMEQEHFRVLIAVCSFNYLSFMYYHYILFCHNGIFIFCSKFDRKFVDGLLVLYRLKWE